MFRILGSQASFMYILSDFPSKGLPDQPSWRSPSERGVNVGLQMIPRFYLGFPEFQRALVRNTMFSESRA